MSGKRMTNRELVDAAIKLAGDFYSMMGTRIAQASNIGSLLTRKSNWYFKWPAVLLRLFAVLM